MKVKKDTITTHTYFVRLESGDWLGLRLGKGKSFGLQLDFPSQQLNFYNLREEAIIGDPVFSISYPELEDLSEGYPHGIEYISIRFPAKYYADVKKRLEGLPIPLPIKETKE